MTPRDLLLCRALLLRVFDRLIPEVCAFEAARVREGFSAAVGEHDEGQGVSELELLVLPGELRFGLLIVDVQVRGDECVGGDRDFSFFDETLGRLAIPAVFPTHHDEGEFVLPRGLVDRFAQVVAPSGDFGGRTQGESAEDGEDEFHEDDSWIEPLDALRAQTARRGAGGKSDHRGASGSNVNWGCGAVSTRRAERRAKE